MKFKEFLFVAAVLIVCILTVLRIAEAQVTDHCVFIDDDANVTVLRTRISAVYTVGDKSLQTMDNPLPDAAGWWAVKKRGYAVKVADCPDNIHNKEVWK